ncbi:MAG: AraC family transcriptional regulator [Spirochaetales bacterium]|uniref:AraC family transcriptional regulator n=1 Tax=Candidatus Thalassospirochaeta sargassi TaxID=3119039 RepID=A0AAJ1IGZ0_9SPIO|nr:AraC family transcriptional regulator [Spirochaetales bacterium]
MFIDYFYRTFTPSPLARQTGLYPSWTGTLKAAENYHCRSRVLDDYFLIFVKEGRGAFKSGATDFNLKKNDCFFLFPGILHSYYTSKKNLLELCWIGFNGFLASSFLRELNLHPAGAVLSLDEDRMNEIAYLIDKLIHSPEDSESIGLSASLLEIFSRLISVKRLSEGTSIQDFVAGENHGPENNNDKILRALAYLDCNFTSDISISGLAEYVSMSRSAFSRLFKKETGRSPQACLIEIRLQQAIHLLSGTMAIREVAHASGFKDEYYFSRCFKNRYSISPNELRKKLHDISRVNTMNTTDKTWL